jgi:CheY-like chemotaxis protein
MSTVLLVDDEEDALLVFSMLLSTRGYRVESAGAAEQALHKIALSPPAVVITDWAMPGMSGAQLCATLRAPGSPFAHIPIIVATATPLAPDVHGKSYDAVLRKPYSADELVHEITALVPEISTAPEERTVPAS